MKINREMAWQFRAGMHMQKQGKAVLTIVLVAWLLRLLVAGFVFRSLLDPAQDYWHFAWEVGNVATSIAMHRGFSSPLHGPTGPTALLPPIYPFLLAAVFRLCGLHSALSAYVMLAVNGLFSALTCIPIYLATKSSLGIGEAKAAAWVWAFYPYAIYFSAGRIWDYSLCALLLTTCFWTSQFLHTKKAGSWFAYGALWGVAALVNPSVLAAFVPLLAIAAHRARKQGSPWQSYCIATVASTVLVISPWMVRNYEVLHIVAPVRDNFWMEFWVGNTGDTSDLVPRWAHPSSSPTEMSEFRSRGEVPYIAEKRALSLNILRDRKGMFLYLCARRFVYYWTGIWTFAPSFLSAEPTAIPNAVFCSFLTFCMLWGIAHWWLRSPGTLIPYIVMVVFFPITYCLTHVLMDYRQPIEPEIIVLVIVGWRCLRVRLSKSAQRVDFVPGGSQDLRIGA